MCSFVFFNFEGCVFKAKFGALGRHLANQLSNLILRPSLGRTQYDLTYRAGYWEKGSEALHRSNFEPHTFKSCALAL